jgi:hypothetical protein
MIMMMKRAIMLMAGLAAMVWIISCDKLDEPYAVKKEGGDTSTTMKRKVLLEDYTGHKCVNCPSAAKAAHTIEAASNEGLVIIAVHAGFFATPGTAPFTADYRTAAGNDWNTEFGINAWPAGLINRTPYEGALVLYDYGQWGNAINAQMELPQEANIGISSDFDAGSRLLEITLETKFLAGLEGTYNLTVCITEDSIIGPQKNSDTLVGTVPVIENYIFMDLLRATINGTWGEEITSSVDTTVTYTRSYNFTMDAAWIPKNCHVVAFVSRADSKNIIQAEKQAVISE